MKSSALLFALATAAVAAAATMATTNATCLYCGHNKTDRQEFTYDDLKYLDEFAGPSQYEYGPKNVAEKFRYVQKAIQKYALYAAKAKLPLKFSDPSSVVDTTELLANGEIQYRNAYVLGLANSVISEINFDDVDKNSFTVSVALKAAEVHGVYMAANAYKTQSGHFYITLADVAFTATFAFDRYMDVQPDVIDAGTVTIGRHESVYTNDEVLATLDDDGPKVAKPYAYYHYYLNEVIKGHIANEMMASFAPLIAKRFVELLGPAALFAKQTYQLPRSVVNVAPGVQAVVSNAQLQLLDTDGKTQKLVNYTTSGPDAAIDMLFAFTAFDLRGHTDWTLKYDNGNAYGGRAAFAVDNAQTIIVASQPYKRDAAFVKFAKTTVNGLEFMLHGDGNCESIRDFAHERVPKVLERALKTYINDQAEIVLKNQFALIGVQIQY